MRQSWKRFPNPQGVSIQRARKREQDTHGDTCHRTKNPKLPHQEKEKRDSQLEEGAHGAQCRGGWVGAHADTHWHAAH